MLEEIIIYTDGGSRGNPGPAAAAFVLTDNNKKQLQAKGIFLGKTTNNVAEYSGVIKALDAAKQIGTKKITLFSDSELLVRQINGQYRVKNKNLKELFAQAMDLLTCFQSWNVNHVYREKNQLADELVNIALDRKEDVEQPPVANKNAEPSASQTTHSENPIRLGVLISGGGRTLLNILDKINAGRLNAEVVLVICSLSKASGVEKAKKAGLNVKIVRKKDFAHIDDFSSRLEEELSGANVDLVIQAGWLCLWKIPQKYENRVMNIHPALLPGFGGHRMWGHHVHEAVIKAGVKISGCTVHFCTNEYDKGPILVQRCCKVEEDDTPATLAARVFEQECIAYPEAIKLFTENRISVQNSKAIIKQAKDL